MGDTQKVIELRVTLATPATPLTPILTPIKYELFFFFAHFSTLVASLVDWRLLHNANSFERIKFELKYLKFRPVTEKSNESDN